MAANRVPPRWGRGYATSAAARKRLERARVASPALAAYLADLPPYVPLSRERERVLAQRIQAGTPDAQAAYHELVTANLRLVVHVALSYADKDAAGTTHLPDLIAAGNAGLCRAAARYSCERGARFATYALWWLRYEIEGAAVLEAVHGARIPREIVSFAHLRKRADVMPLWQRMAVLDAPERLDVPPLDSEDADAPLWADRLTPPDDDDDDDARASQRDLLRRLMATRLTSEQRAVLILRYGLNDPAGRGLSAVSVAARLHLPAHRVAALEAEAIATLRAGAAHAHARPHADHRRAS